MKKTLFILATAFYLNTNAQVQNITTYAGTGVAGYSGDGSTATAAQLNGPLGLAIDAAGNIYIGDYDEQRIRKVTAGGIISTLAGNGVVGFNGDGGQATDAEFSSPYGLAVDATGNVYIADFGNIRIRMINTNGVINTIAGNGTWGYSGDGGQATDAELRNPGGVAVDGAGNLYIADSGNHRIRKINTNGIISTIAGNGTAGFSGDGGAATNAKLNGPYNMTVDAAGNIYIADSGNNRIRKINTNGIISTVVGNGTYAYSGDGGQATAASLGSPYEVTLDVGGNMFITDQDHNVIRKVTTAGIISTIVGNGTAGFTGDGAAATAAEINNPEGTAIDAFGNLYIADYGNSRIRKVINVATTSIEQHTAENNIGIYPNPSNGNFVIETTSTEMQTINMYDLNGKIVFTQSINGKTNIDVNSINEGIYNISMISKEGIVNKRVVIVR